MGKKDKSKLISGRKPNLYSQRIAFNLQWGIKGREEIQKAIAREKKEAAS